MTEGILDDRAFRHSDGLVEYNCTFDGKPYEYSITVFYERGTTGFHLACDPGGDTSGMGTVDTSGPGIVSGYAQLNISTAISTAYTSCTATGMITVTKAINTDVSSSSTAPSVDELRTLAKYFVTNESGLVAAGDLIPSK
ncbi:hypothetical protein [Subtercola frigoramans]|uniref:Uncharacterized protein n=1 Tax=Subtercola frigoramans TaxID=120298 RepID=A0ABS2L5V1_9MICO|nr:hypothetical protein [Subtercola frigoramans]MBM7472478.1 hypothetical protein [Subtercola frigoramans]